MSTRKIATIVLALFVNANIIQFATAATADVALMTGDMTRTSTQRIAVQQAAMALVTESSDIDGDGFMESPVMLTGSGGPTGGGLIPLTSSAPKNDSYGGNLGYCAWDNGSTNSSVNRITGSTNSPSAPVLAIISAGIDGVFQTTCANIAAGQGAQGDDYVVSYNSTQIQMGVGGTLFFGDPVPTVAALNALSPATLKDGQIRVVKATNAMYSWNAGSASWVSITGGSSLPWVQSGSSYISASPIGVSGGSNVGLTSGSYYTLTGSESGTNVVADTTSIQARNNGAASVLSLNPLGGNVTVNGSQVLTAANLTSSNITTALGYTPLNQAGGTVSGALQVTGNLTTASPILINNASQVSGSSSALALAYSGSGIQYGMTLRPTADNTTAINFLNSAGSSVGSITQTSSGLNFNGTATNALTLGGVNASNFAQLGGAAFTGAISAPTIYVNSGVNGLILQSYPTGSAGAIYNSGVTPAANNYALLASTTDTYLNAPSGTIHFRVGNGSDIANITSAGVMNVVNLVTSGLSVNGNANVTNVLNVGSSVAASGVTSFLAHGADTNFLLTAQNGASNNAVGAEVSRFGINYGGGAWNTYFQFLRGGGTQDGSMNIYAGNTQAANFANTGITFQLPLTVSGSVTTPVVNVGSGTSGLLLQSYTGGGWGAIYSNAVTPNGGNYAMVANSTDTIINAASGAVHLRIGNGGDIETISSSGATINGSLNVSGNINSQRIYANASGTSGNAFGGSYDIAGGMIAAQKSIYSYGTMCVGNLSGDCSYANTGTVISASGINIGGANVLTSSNYTSYAPSLTGAGASGTWGINITGNAATLQYQGNTTANTSGILTPGLQLQGVYNNGYPTAYGNVMTMMGGGAGQLLIGWSGTTGANADNYIRSLRDAAVGTNGWSPWAKIITDQNIATYAPSLTGAGATGTWAINVTGSANTLMIGGSATTFNWSGQPGQPTWVWGGNSPGNMYVYNPANFSVNYATTAGTLSNGATISEIYNNGWYRSNGNFGWYSQTYGGGIWMSDSTYVRVYGGKSFHTDAFLDAGSGLTINGNTVIDSNRNVYSASVVASGYVQPGQVASSGASCSVGGAIGRDGSG